MLSVFLHLKCVMCLCCVFCLYLFVLLPVKGVYFMFVLLHVQCVYMSCGYVFGCSGCLSCV